MLEKPVECSIKVTRFDAEGKIFHTCLTNAPVKIDTDMWGNISIDMPFRFWMMIKHGKAELEAC